LWGRCNPDSANGTDKTVYYVASAQAAAGHEVDIFSINDKPPIPVPGCEVKSYPVRRLPIPAGNGRLQELLLSRSPLNLPPALAVDLIGWRPTIVHFHSVHLPPAIRLARQVRNHGIPYCVSLHGGLAVAAQRRGRLAKRVFAALFERRFLNNAAFIHAVSAADVEGARAYGARNRFVLAPNCIDPAVMPDDIDRTLLRRRVPAFARRRLFTYVGRLDPDQKGLDLLLRAWADACSGHNVGLVLVGPDWRGGQTQLQALADSLGILDSVAFFGPVSGKEKWDVLAGTDVFVHPSRWEGASFSVLEAMLAGNPLLITDRVDADGLIARAGAGIVTTPDERGIGIALRTLVEADSKDLARFGEGSRELVHRHFRWEGTTETLLDAYERVSVNRR
jgi:glycosyltransferase involved in cell wall biosynthesis